MVRGVSKDYMMVGDITTTSSDKLEGVLPLQTESFRVLYIGWNLILLTGQATGNLLSYGQLLKVTADSTLLA